MKRTQKKYQFFKKDEEHKLKKIKMRIIYGQLIKKMIQSQQKWTSVKEFKTAAGAAGAGNRHRHLRVPGAGNRHRHLCEGAG